MLIIDDITMPFPGFYMKSNPPLITIELFDQDTIVSLSLPPFRNVVYVVDTQGRTSFLDDYIIFHTCSV